MKYLIYDTALNAVPTLLILQKYFEVNQSLFKDTKDEALIDVAPWVFQVDNDLGKKLIDETDLSMQFTLLVESNADINALSAHLRKFIYQTIDGREYFFRFYDSRVLKKFLPTCDKDQVLEFFGPVMQFIAGGDTREEAIRFRHDSGVLKISESLF
ncbi:MAG TPA: DUF4123 domain-containing protein [Puia sp.]